MATFNSQNLVDTLPTVGLRKDYEILRELGRGKFSKVFLVRHRANGELFAAKLIRLERPFASLSTDSRPAEIDSVQREVKTQFNFELSIAQYLSACPYIIRTKSDAFQTSHHLVTLMEPALGGDLASRLVDPKMVITEQQLKSVAIQLASAIQFMHDRSLIHCDIRPENILLTDASFSVIKLGDFSHTKKRGSVVRQCSVFQNKNPLIRMRSKSTGNFTKHARSNSVLDIERPPTLASDPFKPPELCDLSPSDFYTVHASQDVWGYGMILFCLTIEHTPSWKHTSLTRDSVFANFIKTLGSIIPDRAGPESRQSLPTKSTASGTNQVVAFYHHAFIQLEMPFLTLLRGTLDHDPNNRIRIEDSRSFTSSRWHLEVGTNGVKPPTTLAEWCKNHGSEASTNEENNFKGHISRVKSMAVQSSSSELLDFLGSSGSASIEDDK